MTNSVLHALQWKGGATDLWPLLSDPAAMSTVAESMAAPFADEVDLVAGPDPGGVLFGPLVAGELGVPFAPVCRDRDFFFKGDHPRITAITPRGELHMHAQALSGASRVLLVDDWSESGSTVSGVLDLVSQGDARLVAVSFLVDSLTQEARARLYESEVEVRAVATVGDLVR